VSRKPKKTAKGSIQLIPPIGWKEEQISRLTQFEPHKLDDIVRGAGATEQLDDSAADPILTSFRRKNDEQMEQLLREMHIDLKQPEAWRKAFFRLAAIHHGVGGLSTTPPRRKNKNAKTWTSEQHLIFFQMMQILLQDGISERAAIKKIANDKKSGSNSRTKGSLDPRQPQTMRRNGRQPSGLAGSRLSRQRRRRVACCGHLSEITRSKAPKSSRTVGLLIR